MEFFIPDFSIALSLISVAFLAGMVDAIAGGGGLIVLPALLTVGIPPHLALGTNKLIGTFGTLTAARVCVQRGIFQPKFWHSAIIATFIGAMLGTLTAWFISPDLLNKILPLILIIAAIYMLLDKKKKAKTTLTITTAQNTPISIGLGSTLGFYDGFVGPGTGAFWTTAAMTIYRVNIIEASGIARFMNFISNLVSLITFILLNQVNYQLGLMLGIALMLGAYLGIHSALKWGATIIRPLFIIVVLATTGRLIWLEWF